MEQDFTLVLDREPTEADINALYTAGLDDGAVEYGNGAGVVHVIRDAPTLAGAVVSAIHQIESVGLAVTALETDDLVTLGDIASRTGRTYESVRLLATGARGPGGFPAPMSPSGWSLYSWALVSRWLAEHYDAAGEVDTYQREVAAVDHLVRARHILSDQRDRIAMAQVLLSA